MKNFLLIPTIILAGFAMSNAATGVTNSGATFTPATVSISTRDTVSFSLASAHNVQEVSQATYNGNGTTALSGGFSTPFSGGKVSGLAAGTHYYVCAVHGPSGMKGQIIVQAASNVLPALENSIAFTFQIAGSKPVAFKMAGETARISIVDMQGRSVWSTTVQKNDARNVTWDRKSADGETIATGTYFVQSIALDDEQKPVGKISRTLLQIR